VSGDSLLDLLLGSPDDIVNLGSNLLDLLLPVEALSDLLISLNEPFELLLEAVILIVEICHMLIEGIHFGLQVNLVSHHLLWVLLQSVDLIGHGLLVLLKLVVFDFEFGALQLVVLRLDILVLVSLEKLRLGVFVLLVLILVVAELTVQLIEGILLFLDYLMALLDFHGGSYDSLFLWAEKALHILDSLVIIIDFSSEDWHSLVLGVQLSVKVQALLSETGEFLVGLVTHLLLLAAESLLVGDLLSQVQVNLVVNARLLSQTSQLARCLGNFSLRHGNLLDDLNLLLLGVIVFIFECIKLSD
jgi:hypothetical protein